MDCNQARIAITEWLARNNWGRFAVSYKLRDWLISRQRYWGAPIPIIHCQHCGTVPVPEDQLPVLLPTDIEFKSSGESPLKHHQSFINTPCPQCGAPARRETDTMDTFMCSSWYFLRYTSPEFNQGAYETDRMKYWMPVDLYTGGADHAVMHLFYSRFFTKAIRDMGLVDFDEPFLKLFNQGNIIVNHQKMSKSKGNVINPDFYVSTLGADIVRTYLMFVAPWEQGGEWNDSGISGINRWLNRVWNLSLEDYRPAGDDNLTDLKEFERQLHSTIRKVSQDIDSLHYNTMISALMEFTNYLGKARESGSIPSDKWQEAIRTLLLLLAPSAPHMTEELWQLLGYPYSIHNQLWPIWNEEKTRQQEITLVVQVNGKVRTRIDVPATATREDIISVVLDDDKVSSYIQGKEMVDTINVPGRIVNVVVK